MSDSEEENFCFFGKPLEPYDEGTFPTKKAIAVEDQIATDQQGRRRFHGAFTGGFSAGFFNTVGSLEGWLPGEFKSTRQDKAKNKAQKPQDFMDDEDMGEFGIAPQTVRARSDYTTNTKKRKRQVFSEGPIPGEPVLHSLLSSGNETIGYLLLKNIGLKSTRDLNKSYEDAEIDQCDEQKVYGCKMPRTYEISRHEDINQFVIHDIYREFLTKPKDNTFGLGYVGLSKSHQNLFQPTNLVINDKNKKKLSITGQAFGVGAFEDDDDDIYFKDDLSRYDFELTVEKSAKKEAMGKSKDTIFDEFIRAENILRPKDTFLPPTIPQSFTGKHKVKKSRFEPLPEEQPQPVVIRKGMNPELRARYLGDEQSTLPLNNSSNNGSTPIVTEKEIKKEVVEPETNKYEDAQQKTPFDLFTSSSGLVFDRFVSASKKEDVSDILEVVEKSETTHGTQEMRDAVKLKMFGPLTRITTDWQPCSILCKRFNVPEPHFDELNASRNRKRSKNLIFENPKFDEHLPDLQPGLIVQSSSNNEAAQSTAEVVVQSGELSKAQEVISTDVSVEPSVSNVGNDKKEEADTSVMKDSTEKINVADNIDLFRAVFLSSSDESEEDIEVEKDKETKKNAEIKANILSDTFVPKITPIKQGILSNVDFSMFNSTTPNTSENNVSINVNDESPKSNADVDYYGPKLPNILQSSSFVPVASKHNKHAKTDDDEWVVKGEESKKDKHHHKKKQKKQSYKKKHKHHKHKR